MMTHLNFRILVYFRENLFKYHNSTLNQSSRGGYARRSLFCYGRSEFFIDHTPHPMQVLPLNIFAELIALPAKYREI